MGRGSISLHPEYGVNPTVEACFICGEDTGNLLLLGNNRGKKAEMRTFTGQICQKCQAALDKGAVIFIEVEDGQRGKKDPRRTGFVIGVKREAIEGLVDPDQKVAYVEQSMLREMLEGYDEIKAKAGAPKEG